MFAEVAQERALGAFLDLAVETAARADAVEEVGEVQVIAWHPWSPRGPAPSSCGGIRNGRLVSTARSRKAPRARSWHLGNIAHRTGRSLQCDPRNGHILNDKPAMAYWTREYEKGLGAARVSTRSPGEPSGVSHGFSPGILSGAIGEPSPLGAGVPHSNKDSLLGRLHLLERRLRRLGHVLIFPLAAVSRAAIAALR